MCALYFLIFAVIITLIYTFIFHAAWWAVLICLLLSFAGVNVLFAVTVGLTGLTLKQDKPITKPHRFCRLLVWAISSLACTYAFVHVKVNGREKLPPEGRFMMVGNHRANYDPFIVEIAFPERNIAFVSKPSNMKIPIVGNIAYNCGFLSIDRENDRNALRTILTAADYMKKDLCSMFIYPEGTRCKTGGMLPFHAGSFKVAQKANVPLVIIACIGTEKVSRNACRRRTDVTLDVLETVPAERVKAMSTAELAEYSHNVIYTHIYGATASETEKTNA